MCTVSHESERMFVCVCLTECVYVCVRVYVAILKLLMVNDDKLHTISPCNDNIMLLTVNLIRYCVHEMS